MGSKILIIDDEPDSIRTLSGLLDAYLPDAEVHTADTGAEGIALARDGLPDLVLLDVKLPDLSGFEVCGALKGGPDTADTPVLLMSGILVDTEHRVRGLDVGADGYLCKPFEPPEFIAQVRSLLRLQRSTRALRDRERSLEAELEKRAGDLRESEAKFRTLVESLPFAVVIVQQRHIVFANRATAAVFGLRSPAEIIGQDLVTFVAPEARPRVEAWASDGDAGTTAPQHYEADLLRADGTSFPSEQYVAVIPYRGRPAQQIVAIDITARRESDEALRDRTEELRRAQKMEALGRLVGGVAHDLNNRLTTVLGYGRLLEESAAGDEAMRDDVAQVLRAGEQAGALSARLLAFGHAPSAGAVPLDLNDVVLDADRLLRRTLGEHIELVTLPGDGPAMVEADAGELEQVIVNLATNARDAMPRGGKLTVQVAREHLDDAFCRTRPGLEPGDHVVLEVSDTGCGMPPEVLARAFDPLFTTKGEGGGTGLGLASVRDIVRRAGGHAELESCPGEGTRVWVGLPPASPPRPARTPPPGGPDLPQGAETVLVVEDDASVRRLASRLLASLGYRTLEAGNAGEALLLFEEPGQAIDLVLTDVVMPHLGGAEMVRRFRKTGRAFRTLYMTGFPQEAFVRRGEEDRRAPILLKPFTREELAGKVREALDG